MRDFVESMNNAFAISQAGREKVAHCSVHNFDFFFLFPDLSDKYILSSLALRNVVKVKGILFLPPEKIKPTIAKNGGCPLFALKSAKKYLKGPIHRRPPLSP